MHVWFWHTGLRTLSTEAICCFSVGFQRTSPFSDQCLYFLLSSSSLSTTEVGGHKVLFSANPIYYLLEFGYEEWRRSEINFYKRKIAFSLFTVRLKNASHTYANYKASKVILISLMHYWITSKITASSPKLIWICSGFDSRGNIFFCVCLLCGSLRIWVLSRAMPNSVFDFQIEMNQYGM